MQLTRVIFALGALGALAACGKDDPQTPMDAAVDAEPADAGVDAPSVCDNELRDEDYVPGMSKLGTNGYKVVLVTSTPVIRPKGDYVWDIQVLDPAMQPLDGATIKVGPSMPDHHHGAQKTAVVTPGTGGMYSLSPVNLWMKGYWTVLIKIEDNAATELDAVTFKFCVI
jgi:hypothetical protein